MVQARAKSSPREFTKGFTVRSASFPAWLDKRLTFGSTLPLGAAWTCGIDSPIVTTFVFVIDSHTTVWLNPQRMWKLELGLITTISDYWHSTYYTR